MSISAPVRSPWCSDPDRLMRRFLERLLLTAVVVDPVVNLRFEHDELMPLNGYPSAVYVLFEASTNAPIWCARLKYSNRYADSVSLDAIACALRITGFDPLRVHWLRTPTLCNVYRWGELPRLIEIDGLEKPVIVT